MQLAYVMRLAKQYMALGAIGMFAAILVMVLFSLLYQRKYDLKDRKLAWSNFVATGLLIGYLIIVAGATLLSRGRYETSLAQLKLFETYQEAWYDADMVGWRNLVLNILMFVPIGFLLPFTLKPFRKWWMTYIGGFIVTFLIESTQYIFRCGVFQTDDLLNNLLGTMIGYGGFCIVILIKNSILHRNVQWRRTICSQIPLVVTVISFLTIFCVYQAKEYGNLSCENINTYKKVSITEAPNLEVSEKEKEIMIRKLHVYSKEEVLELARSIFWQTGLQLNASDSSFYDTRATLYSKNRQAAIWVNYQGGTFDYENYSQQYDSHGNPIIVNACATRQRVEKAVKELGVTVPTNATFENQGNGYYKFNLEQSEAKDTAAGFITCCYTVNDMISTLHYYMIETVSYKKCQMYSTQEILQQLKSGKFFKVETEAEEQIDMAKVKKIEVESIQQNLLLDSKGYFRPVFHCRVICDGIEGYIDVPAKK